MQREYQNRDTICLHGWGLSELFRASNVCKTHLFSYEQFYGQLTVYASQNYWTEKQKYKLKLLRVIYWEKKETKVWMRIRVRQVTLQVTIKLTVHTLKKKQQTYKHLELLPVYCINWSNMHWNNGSKAIAICLYKRNNHTSKITLWNCCLLTL